MAWASPARCADVGQAPQARGEGQRLGDRQFGVQRRAFGQPADPAARGLRLLAQVDPGQADRAGVGGEHPGQQPQEGRLAGPVDPEQPQDLARAERQRGLAQDLAATVPAHQRLGVDQGNLGHRSGTGLAGGAPTIAKAPRRVQSDPPGRPDRGRIGRRHRGP
jgi:hypothetical protein